MITARRALTKNFCWALPLAKGSFLWLIFDKGHTNDLALLATGFLPKNFAV
jgi:hypothetical protein